MAQAMRRVPVNNMAAFHEWRGTPNKCIGRIAWRLSDDERVKDVQPHSLYYIGSSPRASFRLAGVAGVAGKHAVIETEGGEAFVQRLAGKGVAPVRVAGRELVPDGPRVLLRPGATLVVGTVAFAFGAPTTPGAAGQDAPSEAAEASTPGAAAADDSDVFWDAPGSDEAADASTDAVRDRNNNADAADDAAVDATPDAVPVQVPTEARARVQARAQATAAPPVATRKRGRIAEKQFLPPRKRARTGGDIRFNPARWPQGKRAHVRFEVISIDDDDDDAIEVEYWAKVLPK